MFFCGAIFLFFIVVRGENVYEALGNNPDLLEFQRLVNEDDVMRVLLQHWSVTVFAPTNEAITSNEGLLIGKENKIASYHVMNLLVNKALFPFTSSSSLAGAPPLYLAVKDPSDQSSEKEYFVNNAKILSTENYISLDGNKQILCVIDEVLQPYLSSSFLPPTAFELMQKPKFIDIPHILSAFTLKVQDEQKLEDLFSQDGNHTFFLPVAFQDQSNLEPEEAVDFWVIRSHVITKHALFTRLAGQKRYPSEAFGKDIRVEVSFVEETVGNETLRYVQSNTIHSDYGHKKGAVLSKIIKANIPVKNGVVHIIKHPLMVIETTVWELLQEEKYSEFFKLVDYSPEFKELLMGVEEKTLLVPSNEAISLLSEETISFIQANITSFLKLHLVMKSISTSDVLNGSYKEFLSSDNTNVLYFRVLKDEETLTVEGGNAKAVAVQSDIGAVDGMIHVLDRFLGIPYETIYQKLQSHPNLRITCEFGEQEEWSSKTFHSYNANRNFTFFAPSNEAWAKIQREMPTEYKQLSMGIFPYHVRKILERHLMVGRVLSFEELKEVEEIQMIHGKFRVYNSSSREEPSSNNSEITLEWTGKTAQIIRPDVQAINGIIHIIDNVMMERRDLTKSAAVSRTKVASFWTASIVAFSLWKCVFTG